MTCVGVPISWPRLERFAAGAADADATAHLEGCAVCRGCLERIRADEVTLPALPASPERRRRRAWLFAPGFALVAAAAAVLLFARARPLPAPTPGPRVAVKGAGEVVLSLVRERGGAVAHDPTTFLPEDRFKARVTCDPGVDVWADVVVLQAGEPAAYPQAAPSAIPCGNAATVPGAFRVTGRTPARICVLLAHGAAPPERAAAPRGPMACLPITPE